MSENVRQAGKKNRPRPRARPAVLRLGPVLEGERHLEPELARTLEAVRQSVLRIGAQFLSLHQLLRIEALENVRVVGELQLAVIRVKDDAVLVVDRALVEQIEHRELEP